MAQDICKDEYLAGDLVGDMYLRLANLDVTRSINNSFIYVTLKHLYLDWIKAERQTTDIERASTICVEYEEVVATGVEVDLSECLTWPEKQILLLRQNMSGRDIEKQYHINFQKVHRIENRAKQKVKQWVKKLEGPEMSLPQLQSL